MAQSQDEASRRLAERCPVCGKLYLPTVLASHVANHLQNDKIVLQIGGQEPGLYIGGNRIRVR